MGRAVALQHRAPTMPVSMPRFCHLLVAVFATTAVLLQLRGALPALRVSDNQRFLVTADGKPFFYLGDTAWELFHRLNREEAVRYLDVRAAQRFNVIQAVALAELEGLTDPNPYGDLPLEELNPARPALTPGNDPANAAAYDYWDHVDFIIGEANRRGIYIGLLPTWGSWVPNERKEDKRLVFNAENAGTYGKFLGQRYRDRGIIWILGGDRAVTGFENIWRALARSIAIGVSGKEDYDRLLMTFHPRGGQTSSTWFHGDPWLDFNMHQTGHSPIQKGRPTPAQRIAADYERTPVKPVMDGEPLYEDHPIGFRSAKELGYSLDAHVRQRAYWDVFSGACGHTYGNHSVWQMYAADRRPINGPILFWHEAIHRGGAAQMQHVRALIESRPQLSRVPDQSLVTDALELSDYIACTQGDGYAFIYSAQGRPFTVNMGRISGERVVAWWFNPRSGSALRIGEFENRGTREFTCPSLGGFGTDVVLVLDDSSKKYPAPGTR